MKRKPVTMKDQPDTRPAETTEKAAPPKSRIRGINHAWSLFIHNRNETARANFFRAQIQGLLDGNPPVSPSVMRSYGLADEPNVNWREGESIIEKKAGAMWEMFAELPTLVDMIPAMPGQDSSLMRKYGRVVGEQVTRIIRDEWEDFHYNTRLKISQLLKYGYAGYFWANMECWKDETINTSNIYFPKNTLAKPSGLRLCFIRAELDFEKIFEIIDSPDTAAALGWSIASLKQALINYAKDQKLIGTNDNDWQAIQKKLRAQDLSTDSEFSIPVVHLLVRENYKVGDKWVSHYMFVAEEFTAKKPDGFLLKRMHIYPDMTQVVGLQFYNVGEGTAATVRGLGYKIFPYCDTSNNFINRAVSGAQVAASLIVQSTSSEGGRRIKITRHGPLLHLPQNLNIVQSSFQPPLQNMVVVRGMLQQIANNNDGVFKVGEEPYQTVDRTAKEVMIKAQNEARFDNQDASWFYVQWTIYLRTIVTRLMRPDYKQGEEGYEEHQQLIERCQANGVPDLVVRPEFWHVAANKAIGLGSTILQQDYTAQALANAHIFDEAGRQEIIRDWTAARFSASTTRRYCGDFNRDQIPSDQQSMAVIENNFMLMGQPALVGADQIHAHHIVRHMLMLTDMVMRWRKQEQFDLLREGPAVQMVIEHIAGHIEHLAQDPTRKQTVKTLVNDLGMFDKDLKEISAAYDAAAQQHEQDMATLQQAASTITDPELQIQLRKVEGNLQIKAEKERRSAKLREDKAVHGMRITEARAAQEMRLREQQQGGQ